MDDIILAFTAVYFMADSNSYDFFLFFNVIPEDIINYR